METTITNSILDYLIAYDGKDIIELSDVHEARKYADVMRSHNYDNVEIEQRNNRVIIKLMVTDETEFKQTEVWPSI